MLSLAKGLLPVCCIVLVFSVYGQHERYFTDGDRYIVRDTLEVQLPNESIGPDTRNYYIVKDERFMGSALGEEAQFWIKNADLIGSPYSEEPSSGGSIDASKGKFGFTTKGEDRWAVDLEKATWGDHNRMRAEHGYVGVGYETGDDEDNISQEIHLKGQLDGQLLYDDNFVSDTRVKGEADMRFRRFVTLPNEDLELQNELHLKLKGDTSNFLVDRERVAGDFSGHAQYKERNVSKDTTVVLGGTQEETFEILGHGDLTYDYQKERPLKNSNTLSGDYKIVNTFDLNGENTAGILSGEYWEYKQEASLKGSGSREAAPDDNMWRFRGDGLTNVNSGARYHTSEKARGENIVDEGEDIQFLSSVEDVNTYLNDALGTSGVVYADEGDSIDIQGHQKTTVQNAAESPFAGRPNFTGASRWMGTESSSKVNASGYEKLTVDIGDETYKIVSRTKRSQTGTNEANEADWVRVSGGNLKSNSNLKYDNGRLVKQPTYVREKHEIRKQPKAPQIRDSAAEGRPFGRFGVATSGLRKG
eukprot:Platyproteum_vivax@DN368_c0_g1_i1.p1